MQNDTKSNNNLINNKINKDVIKSKVSFKKKSTARRSAMQALYSLEISKSDLAMIEKHYLEDRNPKNIDLKYFKLLLNNIPSHKEQLDFYIAKYSSRSIQQLDPIELSILRVACYELLFCQETPFKVIISEALDLATVFGSETSYKFINSVIDRLAKERHTLGD